MSPWLLAIPLAVALGAAVYFWRRTLTLQESLESLVQFNADTVRTLQEKVDQIPQLIKDAKAQAVADYIEANPPVDTGPVTIDGVTYDSLVEAMREITSQSKTILANAEIIPTFFENEAVHGNPWWPNDPPAAEQPDT